MRVGRSGKGLKIVFRNLSAWKQGYQKANATLGCIGDRTESQGTKGLEDIE